MAAPTIRKTTDINLVRKTIAKAIEMKYGTMTAYAEDARTPNGKGVSLQYISNVMAGNKPIPDWMLKRFKIKHVVAEHWELMI